MAKHFRPAGNNRLPSCRILWLLALSAIFASGCALRWEPAVTSARPDIPSTGSEQQLALARNLYNQADDLPTLNAAIEAYRAVLATNPGDYEALVQLSNQLILLGTAHTTSRKKKSELFIKAMHYAERAMYTNDGFKAGVRNGLKPWEAAARLDKEQTEAMFFWVTALQYEFKEGMGLAAKIRNIDWMRRSIPFLKRIEATNPDYGDGAVEFALAISYYVLPEFKGGSKKIGEDYMRKAVEKGERRLLPRWGRGKYFHAVRGNREKAREDLEWVANRDLEDAIDPYPWRVYFKNDAKRLIR